MTAALLGELFDDEADAEAEAEGLLPLPPLLPLVADAVAAALDADAEPDGELPVEPTADAFFSPQVTDKQAVWPSRSLGWAATQSVLHCWHTKDGMVWP